MNKKFWLAALMLLATGLIAVGCGDDDEDEPTTDAPATEEDAPAINTGSDEGDEAVLAAIDACKQGVEAAAGQLSDDTISELEALCDDVGTDPEAAAEANKEICISIAAEVIPEGPARDQALELCEASPTP